MEASPRADLKYSTWKSSQDGGKEDLENQSKRVLTVILLQTSKDNKITNWADKSGEFKRGQSQFRDRISKQEDAEFPAEKGRYHLYVSYACPWGQDSERI